ncbi:hypothetical protein DSO57_1020434 [Entomophthora muscae]|uniref:Uncharacterized protein n=1 Tax=Entomophthora muscae TaxID=34485 RepID=A0ACC2TRA0_9FUNG|nr:hypothetical protein DSO57_1020434 [Entomophthora muscae]
MSRYRSAPAPGCWNVFARCFGSCFLGIIGLKNDALFEIDVERALSILSFFVETGKGFYILMAS